MIVGLSKNEREDKIPKTKGCLKIELKIWNQLLMNFC